MIKDFIIGVVKFFRDVFSDGGQPSFSRVAAGFSLLCSMKWVHFMVYKHGEIPDLLNVLYLVGGLYSINRISSILEAYVAAKAGAQPKV